MVQTAYSVLLVAALSAASACLAYDVNEAPLERRAPVQSNSLVSSHQTQPVAPDTFFPVTARDVIPQIDARESDKSGLVARNHVDTAADAREFVESNELVARSGKKKKKKTKIIIKIKKLIHKNHGRRKHKKKHTLSLAQRLRKLRIKLRHRPKHGHRSKHRSKSRREVHDDLDARSFWAPLEDLD